MESGIQEALQLDTKVIVEEAIPNAREIECSVLGNHDPDASVLGEIIPSNEFYDYDAKYIDGKSTEVIPAKISETISKEIRELANAIERALIVSTKDVIDVADLPILSYHSDPIEYEEVKSDTHVVAEEPHNGGGALRDAVDKFERVYIENALKKCKGDKAEASKILKVSLSKLYRKLDRLDIE